MTDILLGVIIWFLFINWYKDSRLKFKINYLKRKWREPKPEVKKKGTFKDDVSVDKY